MHTVKQNSFRKMISPLKIRWRLFKFLISTAFDILVGNIGVTTRLRRMKLEFVLRVTLGKKLKLK